MYDWYFNMFLQMKLILDLKSLGPLQQTYQNNQ